MVCAQSFDRVFHDVEDFGRGGTFLRSADYYPIVVRSEWQK